MRTSKKAKHDLCISMYLKRNAQDSFESSSDTEDDERRPYVYLKSGNNFCFAKALENVGFFPHRLGDDIILRCFYCDVHVPEKFIFSKTIENTNETENPEFEQEHKKLLNYHKKTCTFVSDQEKREWQKQMRELGFYPLANKTIIYGCHDCHKFLDYKEENPIHTENCTRTLKTQNS